MPLILGTNSITATAYDVANSCRFDDGSSDYMHITRGSAGNQKTFTISMWIKRRQLGSSVYTWTVGPDGNNNFVLYFDSNDQLEIWEYKPSAYNFRLKPTHKFRDVSAWYHLCVAFDTTQSTSTNRVKVYVNGTQLTDFDTTSYPSLNYDTFMNSTSQHWLGKYTNQSYYFDGYICEMVVIDGQQLDPTSFGEFDSASPNIWKPKDVSGLTFGTNGFYLDFEDSSALGNDANGGSDFTVVNLTSIDQSTDTCTNNGCTLNPLASVSTPVFTNGNLTINGNGTNSSNQGCPATFVLSKGKWYWEMKNESSNHANYIIPGFVDAEYYANLITGSGLPGNYYDASNGFTNNVQGGGDNVNYVIHRAGSSNSGLISGGLLQNQIYSFALDLDNRKCWFRKDGTYYNSGDPAAGSNETWGTSDIVAGKSYTPVVFHYYTGSQGSFNFGSPAFSISSGNSDANGYGNFEYSVPSGFYAINSKNLAEFG